MCLDKVFTTDFVNYETMIGFQFVKTTQNPTGVNVGFTFFGGQFIPVKFDFITQSIRSTRVSNNETSFVQLVEIELFVVTMDALRSADEATRSVNRKSHVQNEIFVGSPHIISLQQLY